MSTLPTPIPNPTTRHRSSLPALHPPNQETNMDEPRTRRRTIATLAITTLLTISCGTNPTTHEAQMTPTTTIPDYTGFDLHTHTGQALQTLDAFLTSITTTTIARTTSNVAPNFDSGDGSMWDRLAQCESGGNWAYPPVAGGFSGGLMFHIGTWRAMGGQEFAPDAYLASREQQIEIAERTKAAAGGSMRPWPGCSRRLGLL